MPIKRISTDAVVVRKRYGNYRAAVVRVIFAIRSKYEGSISGTYAVQVPGVFLEFVQSVKISRVVGSFKLQSIC